MGNEQYEKEFAEGNYVGSEHIATSGDFTSCDQVCTEWCWATGATMVASHFTSVSSCGEDEARVAGEVFGNPCSTSCPSSCNQPGSFDNILTGIELLSGVSYAKGDPPGGAISQSALDSALALGPVVVGVYWHYGKSGGNYQIHDPEGEDHAVAYSGVTNYEPSYGKAQGYTGMWVASAYSTSDPTPALAPLSGTVKER